MRQPFQRSEHLGGLRRDGLRPELESLVQHLELADPGNGAVQGGLDLGWKGIGEQALQPSAGEICRSTRAWIRKSGEPDDLNRQVADPAKEVLVSLGVGYLFQQVTHRSRQQHPPEDGRYRQPPATSENFLIDQGRLL